jgi:hypothetical protein
MACPVATQDIQVNLKNRQHAIAKAEYGPLNPEQPNEDFWKKKGEIFDTTPEEAKKSRCGNCAAFNVTTPIRECIAKGIGTETGDEWDIIAEADLGYCELFDFKCAAQRTCNAWVVGGPLTDEKLDKKKGFVDALEEKVNQKE